LFLLQIKPEFINAAKALLDYGVPLAQIEGTKHKEIADEFKVRGWPTLYIFRHGKAFEYKGGRETKSIVSHMREQLQSPSKNCKNLQEIENRIERYIPTIIGVFSSEKSLFYQEFFAVANYLRGEPLRFLHTFNKKTGKALGVKKENGEVIIVKKPSVFLSDYEPKESKLADVSFLEVEGVTVKLHLSLFDFT
jgi:protein disulfide-isomerase A4